jgi:RNA polymerase sigma factor (sigma-70 family)
MIHLKHVTDGSLPESGAGQPGAPQTQQAGPDEQLERLSTVSWLQKRISTLPDRQREVLVLSTLKGLSMREIAGVLEVPENTVKTHLRRARLSLAESLASREDKTAPAGWNRQ